MTFEAESEYLYQKKIAEMDAEIVSLQKDLSTAQDKIIILEKDNTALRYQIKVLLNIKDKEPKGGGV